MELDSDPYTPISSIGSGNPIGKAGAAENGIMARRPPRAALQLMLSGTLEWALGGFIVFISVIAIMAGFWVLLSSAVYGFLLFVFGFMAYGAASSPTRKKLLLKWRRYCIILCLCLVAGICCAFIFARSAETHVLFFCVNVVDFCASQTMDYVIGILICIVLVAHAVGTFFWTRRVLLGFEPISGRPRSLSTSPITTPPQLSPREHSRDTVNLVRNLPARMDSPLPFVSPSIDELRIRSPSIVPLRGEDPMAARVRSAVSKFNNAKPELAIQYLVDNAMIKHTPEDVATWLFRTDNLNLEKLGDYLGEGKAFNIEALRSFARCFDFTDMTVDDAMRTFLCRFRLPGEAQKIDRIMESFSKRYAEHNPAAFPSADTVYVLSFSLIMLNTDAHNPQIKKKMTKRQFISNNRGIGADGSDVPEHLLGSLYDRIVKNKIKVLSDQLLAKTVRQGYLRKKGRNGTFQRRFFVLSNNCLYYFLAEEDPDPRSVIPLEGLRADRGADHDGEFTIVLNNAHSLEAGVKSVKLEPGKPPEEARHSTWMFSCATEQDREAWLSALQANIIGDPVAELVSKRRFGRSYSSISMGSDANRRDSEAVSEALASHGSFASGASSSAASTPQLVSSPSNRSQMESISLSRASSMPLSASRSSSIDCGPPPSSVIAPLPPPSAASNHTRVSSFGSASSSSSSSSSVSHVRNNSGSGPSSFVHSRGGSATSGGGSGSIDFALSLADLSASVVSTPSSSAAALSAPQSSSSVISPSIVVVPSSSDSSASQSSPQLPAAMAVPLSPVALRAAAIPASVSSESLTLSHIEVVEI